MSMNPYFFTCLDLQFQLRKYTNPFCGFQIFSQLFSKKFYFLLLACRGSNPDSPGPKPSVLPITPQANISILKNVIILSKWQDSNLRPPAPKAGYLPTDIHLVDPWFCLLCLTFRPEEVILNK